MLRLGWLSDIHLNFLKEADLIRFFKELASLSVDAWLVGGDIGEAESVVPFLRRFEDLAPANTYFVLGNHDYYGGSHSEVNAAIWIFVGMSERLTWLTASEPQILTEEVVLVGDDSWADARLGDPFGSTVELNDFYLIAELMNLSREDRIRTLNRLGDQAAARLEPKLLQAASLARKVVVLTHVPPFREATWHRGKISAHDWLPWFSCKAVGDVISNCAGLNPKTEFMVLCGHTHGSGVYTPTGNLKVLTAEAEYGRPCVQEIFQCE